MPGYLGNDPAGSATKIARQTYTTSGAATTDFTFTSGYDVGYLDVYVNGERQTKGKNFTASDGSTFKVLNGGVGTGSTVEAIAYKTFNLATVDFDDLGNTGNLTLTGDISGVNATFTGDVSIGGTLTYEDVTNIDSVGVITARAGVDIITGGIDIVGNTTGLNVTGVGTFVDVNVSGTSTISGNLVIADKIVHKGDTDTAIRFPAANTVSVDVAGSERLRITNQGNVGIGTTIAGGKLQIDGGELLVGTKTVKNVASTTNATAIFRDDGGAHTIIAVESNAASGGGTLALSASRRSDDNGFTILQDNDVLGEIRFAGDDGTNLQHSGARIIAEVDGTPAEDNMPGALTFLTNSGGTSVTERLRITGIGSVGIATATPFQSILHVCEGTDYQGIFINGNGAPRINFARSSTTTVEWGVGVDGTNGNRFAIAQAGNTAKLVIDTGGNVNITGITTANQLFEGTSRVATAGKAIAMALIFG